MFVMTNQPFRSLSPLVRFMDALKLDLSKVFLYGTKFSRVCTHQKFSGIFSVCQSEALSYIQIQGSVENKIMTGELYGMVGEYGPRFMLEKVSKLIQGTTVFPIFVKDIYLRLKDPRVGNTKNSHMVQKKNMIAVKIEICTEMVLYIVCL